MAITGANGFIGRNLCERFSELRWDVRPVMRRDFESGAFRDLFARADVVVHAAGATRVPPPTAARLLESNAELTRRVAEAAARAHVGRLVFISSQAAAGPAGSPERPLAEDAPCAPIEAYGRSKLEGERAVRDVAAGANLPFVIIRPSAVYGPGDADFLTLFRLARRRIALHPANRAHWTSIVHVADLADGVMAAATADAASGETFFLSNDEPVQWSALFEAAARSADASLTLDVDLPQPLVTLGAAVGDLFARVTGRAGLVTSEKVALARPRYWICSNARAKRLLGFRPRIALQDGFDQTYRWYLDNGWL